jgi:hypothetical protein
MRFLRNSIPSFEWRPAPPASVRGEATVYSGREGVRERLRPETENPVAYVADAKDGKAILVRTYLDPKEALEPVRLRK